MSRTMPRQKPGRSKQDFRTPPVFLDAVKRRLGIEAFSIDLAATPTNAVASTYYTVADNALVQPWTSDGVAWLNPEFADIGPWVQRAAEQAALGAKIAMLVPAAVGSNWWRDHVHHKCFVLLLNGRLTFVGHTQPYVKDCCLLLYGPPYGIGYAVWPWMRTLRKAAA